MGAFDNRTLSDLSGFFLKLAHKFQKKIRSACGCQTHPKSISNWNGKLQCLIEISHIFTHLLHAYWNRRVPCSVVFADAM
jgi:hypothetical protein